MDSLKGNKTYIVAALAGVVTTIKVLGYIDEDTYTAIMGFLVSLGGVTMAAKMNRGIESTHVNELKLNHLLGIQSVQSASQNIMRTDKNLSGVGQSGGQTFQNQRAGTPLIRK